MIKGRERIGKNVIIRLKSQKGAKRVRISASRSKEKIM